MMRSLFAGVTALRNHQIQMDVIGNNIANVNTIGFKSSRVTFQQLLSQTVRDATAPQGERGGTNPLQVGLGSQLAAINVQHTQGNPQTTGVETDLSIQGNGFFILSKGNERFYTRAGMFDVDEDGNLVSLANGLKVMGWMADDDGEINTNTSITEVSIPKGATISPKPTTTIEFSGNLDSTIVSDLSYVPSAPPEFQFNGQDIQLDFDMTPTGDFNEWTVTLSSNQGTFVSNGLQQVTGTISLEPDGTVEVSDFPVNGSGNIELSVDDGAGNVQVLEIRPPQVGDADAGAFRWDVNQDGNFDDNEAESLGQAPDPWVTSITTFDSLGNGRDVIVNFMKTDDNNWAWEAEDDSGVEVGSGTLIFDTRGKLVAQTGTISMSDQGGAQAYTITPDFSQVTQFGEESDAMAASQDGYTAGTLKSFSVDSRGVINGAFSNGLTRNLGQVAVATFANPGGLVQAGESLYQDSTNSGSALVGVAGAGQNGTLSGGTLEMSNVDLSQEFTNMIITQRGFQANSRIITTSDEMLQELVNLKR